MMKQGILRRLTSGVLIGVMAAGLWLPVSITGMDAAFAATDKQGAGTVDERADRDKHKHGTGGVDERPDKADAEEHGTGGTDETSSKDSDLKSVVGGSKTLSALPSSYDSRKYGFVTSVKDQDWLDLCWSYATIAAVECSLLAHKQVSSAKSLDLSERQLAYFTYNLVPDKMGNTKGDKNIPIREYYNNYIENYGNAWITTETMASGIGVAKESKVPSKSLIEAWEAADYEYTAAFRKRTDLASILARGANSWRLSQARRIPIKNMAAVKQAIKTYGGLAVLTYLDIEPWYNEEISWNEEKAAFFNNGIDESNHMVTIVGWDDNYDRNNFKDGYNNLTPKKNGAWLCKNSYGTYWGDKGYYWISYEDYYFAHEEDVAAYAFLMKPAKKSEILYQYDGSGSNFYNTVKSGGSIANMYKVRGASGSDEVLKSVSLTELSDSNVNYSIQIYTNCSKKASPTSGKAAFSKPQKGKITYPGVYNIPLKKSVRLKAGSKFAVVIKLSHSNKAPVGYDVDASGYMGNWLKTVSAVSPYQSFEKDNAGAKWDDLSSTKHDKNDEPKCAARIKAITIPVKGISQAAAEKTIKSMKKDKDPKGSKFSPLLLRSSKQTAGSVKIKWKKVSGAKKYMIFGNACGTKNKMKKLATVKVTSKNFTKVAGKKVKKGKYYKFLVVAVNKKGMVVSISKLIHAATKGGKAGNHKSVTMKAKNRKVSKITLKKGKTLKLKVKLTPVSKKLKVSKHVGARFESTKTGVASVNSKGVVKAKSKGSCYIYAFAQNGAFKKIKVTVK